MPRSTVARRAADSHALRWGACSIVVGLAFLGGCSSTKYVKLREAPKNPLTAQLDLTSRAGPKPSHRTMQMLRRYDAVNDLKGDPHQLVAKFQEITEREPSIELAHTTAELAYIAGKKIESKNEKAALDFYETAVAYAYLYLFDERYGPARNPYDPQFRGACDLYNSSLESALRIVREQGQLVPGSTHTIESATRRCDVNVVIRSQLWHPDDFERFEFVSDYEVSGLTNQYHTFGLGVPLIAVRKCHPKSEPSEKYYPPDLSFAVTAFLRVVPQQIVSDRSPAPRQVLLELYDPLESTDIEIAGRRVPLESDGSTALAFYLNNPQLNINEMSTAGLLRPDLSETGSSLYMLEPYDPNKIPVVMVHGLWSSPFTWMEMFNDLRSDPMLRRNYQFWFYLYPTGQPFWNSAVRFRDDLAKVRTTVDPEFKNGVLDQMVLVGHSMGGLISKLQTVESRDDYWRIVSDQPFQEVKATPETRARLEKLFYFRPNPSVRRVVTIGTPHRGSEVATGTVRWLSHKLIKVPQMAMLTREEVLKDNPGLFRDPGMLEVRTSIDSLAPDSPILPVLLESPAGPGVVYHNIIGVLQKHGFVGKFIGSGDGVVTYESAHLDNVASEITVNSDHVNVHRHPVSILEVRRILLEHLEQSPIRPATTAPLDYDLHLQATPQPMQALPLPLDTDALPATRS
jgi:pimeloyl-ACP methyl ester carboxylesterase